MAAFNRNIDFKLSATDTASPVIRGVESSFERVQKSYQQLVGALGIGLSAGYFLSLVKGAIEAQDALSKLSQKVGISVEALAGYQHAAQLAGVSDEALVKGFKSLATQMVDSSMGLKESQRNFAALGVEVKNAHGTLKTTENVMIEVADRFAKMQDGAVKSALAVKLFGKAGLDMIPMLNQGSAALAQMIAEGQRLNPVTAESARQAEEFNDNLSRLESSVSAVGINILNDLLPSLSSAADLFSKAALSADGFWKSVSGWALTSGAETADPATRINDITKSLVTQREQLESHRKSWMAWYFADDIALLQAAIVANEAKLSYLRGLTAQREPKDNWDMMGFQRFTPTIVDDTAIKKTESAYAGLINKLEEKLILDKETTEVDKLMFALDRMRGDLYEELTIEQLANLEATAHEVDLKNQAKVALEAYVKLQEFDLAQQKEVDEFMAERDKKVGDAILATGKQIEQMELETSLIGKTNVERETAIFLRQAEIDKIDAATIARGKEAIAAKHAAQESNEFQVGLFRSVESAGHQAWLSIFDTTKSVLERTREMLRTHVLEILYQLTVKRWTIQVVTAMSGAGVAQQAFGSTGAASSMGSIGNLFSGLGSFASGISSVARGADWSSITGAAAGATGIVDSVFQTMGVKLGSQFIADIGNFNWGVPVLSGVIMALSGNVAGGIGSTIGGIAGSYFGPVGTAVGSFLGGMLGSALGGGGGHSAAGTGYRIAGSATSAAGFAGSFIGLSASDEAQYQAPLGSRAAQQPHFDTFNAGLVAVTAGMEQLAGRLNASGALSGKTFNVDVTGPLDMPQVIQMALASVAQQMAEELVPNLRDYRQENEALDATLNRLIGDMDAVRIVFDTLGKTAGLTVETSERLVAVFGGLNNLRSQFQAYYDAFYTEAERTAFTTRQLAEAFRNLGIVEPQTRNQFRALVDSLDLTTAAGALTFKALMDIAPAFDQVAKAAEAAGVAVLSLAEQISAAQTSALTAIEAQIRASETAADTARSTADAYRQITTSLADAVARIQGGGRGSFGGTLESIFSTAMTGNAAALGALPQAAEDFLSASKASSRTALEFARDQAKALTMLRQAGAVSTGMANWQDNQAMLLQTQVEALEAIRAQLELPSPDAAILEQQAGLLSTIAGLLEAQTVQIVAGNAGQALLMHDQTGQIVLANTLTTDQTGQIALGNTWLAQSIVVDSVAALNAVERATAIVQATQGLNAGQGVIQALLSGQTVEIVGGNLIQRDQSGQIVASNELLREQAGALTLGNALVGTQTQQIITGNATQDAIRNIGALNTTYSEQMLTALVTGATIQSDSLTGILGASDTTVSLLRQLVGLMGQSQVDAAAAIAAEESAAAIRTAQASASQAAATTKAMESTSAATTNAAVLTMTSSEWAGKAVNSPDAVKYLGELGYQMMLITGWQDNFFRSPSGDLVSGYEIRDLLHGRVPGFATGLSYVPYDDYLMRAHQGEAVLTAPQAADWRSGGAGINSADLAELVGEVKEMRREIVKLQRPAEITANATSRHKDLAEQTVFGGFSVQTRAAGT